MITLASDFGSGKFTMKMTVFVLIDRCSNNLIEGVYATKEDAEFALSQMLLNLEKYGRTRNDFLIKEFPVEKEILKNS